MFSTDVFAQKKLCLSASVSISLKPCFKITWISSKDDKKAFKNANLQPEATKDQKILISAALALRLQALQRCRESAFAPLASKQREEAPQVQQELTILRQTVDSWNDEQQYDEEQEIFHQMIYLILLDMRIRCHLTIFLQDLVILFDGRFRNTIILSSVNVFSFVTHISFWLVNMFLLIVGLCQKSLERDQFQKQEHL